MVWIGQHSDRSRERRWHVAGPALVGALGLLLSCWSSAPALALATFSFAALGIWGALGPFWNLGGFVGLYAVGMIKDATNGFGLPMAALASCLVAAAILALRAPAD